MTKYIGNAFSLAMVRDEDLNKVFMVPCMEPDSRECVSVVGHADTAAMLGVAFNRVSLQLEPGDELYVAQYQGGRLPEGATTLPEGSSFRWILVSVRDF
jgi:hypothetical protein